MRIIDPGTSRSMSAKAGKQIKKRRDMVPNGQHLKGTIDVRPRPKSNLKPKTKTPVPISKVPRTKRRRNARIRPGTEV